MSEQELYELARKRIDRRNRRWTLWSINLGGLILSLAVRILLGSDPAATFFMAWAGVFTLHTILLGLAESRDEDDEDIEQEVAKLRDTVYEKPKRLELDEDGELVDPADADEFEHLRADKRQEDSV
jgi:hypothetical protein